MRVHPPRPLQLGQLRRPASWTALMGVDGSAGLLAPAAKRRGPWARTPQWPMAMVPLSTALVSCPYCKAYLGQSVPDALPAYPFAGEAPFARRRMPANSSPGIWVLSAVFLVSCPCWQHRAAFTPTQQLHFSHQQASVAQEAAPAGPPHGVHQVLGPSSSLSVVECPSQPVTCSSCGQAPVLCSSLQGDSAHLGYVQEPS